MSAVQDTLRPEHPQMTIKRLTRERRTIESERDRLKERLGDQRADPALAAGMAALSRTVDKLASTIDAMRAGHEALRNLLLAQAKFAPAQHERDKGGEVDLLYGVPAIAEFLGVRTRQAKHRVATGEIPTFRIGESICARRSTLNAWLTEQEAKSRRTP